MSTIRVNKSKNYTVMSNYHFKEKEMSLKAKGLLSMMYSLPDDWDYTVSGLVALCKENETAIKAALDELKKFGYLVVTKLNPDQTKSGRFEYVYDLYEKPHNAKQEGEKQGVENLGVENHPLYKCTNNKASSSLRSEYAGNSTSDEDGDCCNSLSVSGKKADDIFTDLLDVDKISDEETTLVYGLIQKGGFPHKLPAPGKTPSKVFSNSISLISDIASANFLKWEYDPEWKKRNVDSDALRRLSDEVFKFSDAVDLVDSVLDDYNLAKTAEYWPRDKHALPRTFPDFLYNEHTGKSWFIHFLTKGAQKLEDHDAQESIEQLPKAFHKVLGNMDLSWKKHLPKIAKNVGYLAEWHARTRQTLDRYTDYSWLYNSEDFWDSYLSYVADVLDGDHPCPGHFTPYGKMHQSWMEMEHDEHEVNWTYLSKVKGERERGYTDAI